jgi:hypothetical protein
MCYYLNVQFQGQRKIRWTDRVQNAVSQEVEEERNILRTIKRKEGKLDWSHVAHEQTLKHSIEGNI